MVCTLKTVPCQTTVCVLYWCSTTSRLIHQILHNWCEETNFINSQTMGVFRHLQHVRLQSLLYKFDGVIRLELSVALCQTSVVWTGIATCTIYSSSSSSPFSLICVSFSCESRTRTHRCRFVSTHRIPKQAGHCPAQDASTYGEDCHQ